MNTIGLASLAGAAALALAAGCGRQPEPPIAQAPRVDVSLPDATAAPATRNEETLASASAAEADPHVVAPTRGGGAFGIGIRPTGSSANGITP